MKNLFLFRIIVVILTLFLFYQNTPAEQVNVQGITESYRDSTLNPAVNGVISIIYHREGDFVKEGEIILELENLEETLEVKLRKLVYESSLKVYEKTQSISREELQKEETEYQMAQARLDKKRIAAPFDGIIVKIFKEVGESAELDVPLARIVDVRKCRFVVYVESPLTWEVAVGMKVPITIEDAQTPVCAEGIVEFVSPVVDPSSILREVHVLFDNPSNKVLPGVPGFLMLKKKDDVR